MDATTETGGHSRDLVKLTTRLFCWAILAHFAAWMINMVLNNSFNWPGVGAIFGGDNSGTAAVQVAIYAIALAIAVSWVWRTEGNTLRSDSSRISNFNTFLVRWAFFAVLFIGLADMMISFLRIEGLLDGLVGKELTIDLGRSAYRGPWVHVPMMALGFLVALRAKTLGFHWLALLIVVAELAIVFTRFIFSYEQAFMGDLVRFWYAALFLFASAYTLLEDGHVRVDIFYAGLKNRTKGFLNALSSILLGISLCWAILVICLGTSNAIVYAPVSNFEVSQSGFGMYVKYLMASFLVVFAVTMLIQFVAYILESVADWREEPGTRLKSTGDHDLTVGAN